MSDTKDSPAETEWTPKLRALLALVIFMGVLIFVGLIVVVVTVANRLSSAGEERPAAGGFGTADIPIPAGCEVLETRSDGDRLVLRLGRGGRCNQVVIVDLKTGAVAGRLNFIPTE
jgi:hypothetical protein